MMQDEPARPLTRTVTPGQLVVVQGKAFQRLISRCFEPRDNVHVNSFLDLICNQVFNFSNSNLVALVESPLLDSLSAYQSSLREDTQVLAGGVLAYAQFSGDEYGGNAVLPQVGSHLTREVLGGMFKPFQNLEAAGVRQGPQCEINSHIDN